MASVCCWWLGFGDVRLGIRLENFTRGGGVTWQRISKAYAGRWGDPGGARGVDGSRGWWTGATVSVAGGGTSGHPLTARGGMPAAVPHDVLRT